MFNSDDKNEISQLNKIFNLQKSSHQKEPHLSLKIRQDLIALIPGAIMRYAGRLADAMNEDFGYHNRLTTFLFDSLNVAERAQHAIENLEVWMQRDYREVKTELYGSSKAYIEHQAKGVVGNLSAWNFPIDLSIGPMIEMLAAGNRVILKPSEQVPNVSQVLKEMIASIYNPDQVSVVTGGIELAKYFSTLPWDHLLYTGNSTIGREVLTNAAENLVPTTLELGGKNPTIFTKEAVTAFHVDTMIGTKLIKNGQLCITVDHVFVPEEMLDEMLNLVRSSIETKVGDFTLSNALDCTVINDRQYERVQNYINNARDSINTGIIEIGSPATNDGTRRMPFTVIVNPKRDALVSKNEVFGPILPIFTYTSIDDVLITIQLNDRPLGVYLFSEDRAICEKIKMGTSSGGFTINGPALQGAMASLGFGGVGKSGMGRHHGIDGFKEFSNPRGIVEVEKDRKLSLLSPHQATAKKFIDSATGGLLQ